MRKASVTVTTAVQISRICMVAGVSQVDCSTVQIGGYACGHTKTEVALRDELPVSLCPRLAGFALID